MLITAPIFAGVVIAALTLLAPAAIAGTPKCTNQANKFVACTSDLKAKGARSTAGQATGKRQHLPLRARMYY